jgi:hypothetical protein
MEDSEINRTTGARVSMPASSKFNWVKLRVWVKFSILGCAVRKALRIVSEDSDKSDSEIFESMRDLALEYGQSGKTVIQVVKFLRSIDSDEIK